MCQYNNSCDLQQKIFTRLFSRIGQIVKSKTRTVLCSGKMSNLGKKMTTISNTRGGDSGSSWTGCVNSIFLKDPFRRYSMC